MARKPSFAAAVRSGGLPALEAIRDQIARDIESCESFRDRAALFLRLVDVLARIEAARGSDPLTGDAIDQLQQRRARRLGPAGTGHKHDILVD